MSKLVLIDGNAILHRAYHALPPLTTKSGEPINAVYGLVSMLLRVIQDLKPSHIVFCFDRKEPTFRQKIFKDYQIQRPIMDEELSGQIEKAHNVVEAFRIPIYSKAGYEADDLLGTLANQAKSLKLKAKSKKPSAFSFQPLAIDEVVIVTGDRDILQLVDDKKNIKLYMPVKGMGESKFFNEKEVVEKTGVNPTQIVDYKALVGDPSDNYPGVTGIGPKTAASLLGRFKTLQGVYRHLGDINESTRKKLEEGRESAYLSLKLAKIVTDVKLEINLEKAGNWQVDNQDVLDLFSKFGFKTLTKRVKKVGKKIVAEKQKNLF